MASGSVSRGAAAGELLCYKIYHQDTVRAIRSLLSNAFNDTPNTLANDSSMVEQATNILNDVQYTWPLIVASNSHIARELDALLLVAKSNLAHKFRFDGLVIYLIDPPQLLHKALATKPDGQLRNILGDAAFSNWYTKCGSGRIRDKKLNKPRTLSDFANFITATDTLCKTLQTAWEDKHDQEAGETGDKEGMGTDILVEDDVADEAEVLVPQIDTFSIADTAETVNLTPLGSRNSSPTPTVRSLNNRESTDLGNDCVNEPSFKVTYKMVLRVNDEEVEFASNSADRNKVELKMLEATRRLWRCLAANDLLGKATLADIAMLARRTIE